MNEIFVVAGTAVIACGLVILLKQYKPEFAFAVLLFSGIIMLFFIFGFFKDIFNAISDIAKLSGIENEKFRTLFRCAGICFITKIASETCTDCGQGSLSSKVELAGKVLILTAALPFFAEITDIIKIFIDI